MGWLGALVQLGDFVWKACTAYALTAEGQKELNDIGLAFGVEEAKQSTAKPPTPANPARR